MLLPALALATLALALERSGLDAAARDLFLDKSSGTFPLQHSWFFGGLLHDGGTYMLLGCGLLLGLCALLRPRRARATCAFVFSCLALSAALAWVWSWALQRLAPESMSAPDVHSAMGYAWISVYFLGLPVAVLPRTFWLVPGIALGSLMTLAQVVRGAEPVSHGFWSLTLAWVLAATLAAAFRRRGWLEWNEPTSESADAQFSSRAEGDSALPWLMAVSAGLAGVAFYSLDLLLDDFGSRFESIDHWFQGLELAVMGFGLGAGAYFMAEHLRDTRARARRRIAAEREERLRMLGRVAASVAHEVRNPLQTMRMIVDEQRVEIPELAGHALSSAFEGCFERIDHAVDLVYRLARPESEEGEHADLARATREAAARLERSSLVRPTFRWTAEGGPAVVRGSAVSLGIVIDNLLRNAVSASPPDGEVTLTVNNGQDSCSLRITNRGQLDERANAAPQDQAPRPDGLGLGLAISRQIAANAGGRIDLGAQEGQVSCVLTWPADRDSKA